MNFEHRIVMRTCDDSVNIRNRHGDKDHKTETRGGSDARQNLLDLNEATMDPDVQMCPSVPRSRTCIGSSQTVINIGNCGNGLIKYVSLVLDVL